MKRIALVLLAVGLAAAAFLVSAQASTPKLTGTVGPGYTITLKQGAAKVKTLKAGKYTFVITDKAAIHNFKIEREKGGPKIEKMLTDTSFQGKKTVTVVAAAADGRAATGATKTRAASATPSASAMRFMRLLPQSKISRGILAPAVLAAD